MFGQGGNITFNYIEYIVDEHIIHNTHFPGVKVSYMICYLIKYLSHKTGPRDSSNAPL